MKPKPPILMTFFGISNGRTLLVGGQLAYSLVNDLSFQDFSTYKNIKTLVNLYRTRSLKNQKVTLRFNNTVLETETDLHGAFQLAVPNDSQPEILTSVTVAGDVEVSFVRNLYLREIQYIEAPHIVVSDIDDTLLHSFIRSSIKKVRKILFTRMEKRKPVLDMKKLIERHVKQGAVVFYLSNSEQNLYPLIYNFLQYNRFPEGPLLLKRLRKIMDLLLNRKNPKGKEHKLRSLDVILEIFQDKKFILVGDNTQEDLSIYLTVAKKFPEQVEQIVIREVYPRKRDRETISRVHTWLEQHDITLKYARSFDAALS